MAVLSEEIGGLLFTWFSIRVGFSSFTLLSELVTRHLVVFSQGKSGTAPPYPSGNSQLPAPHKCDKTDIYFYGNKL